MDRADFASLVRSDPVEPARKTPQPVGSLTHSHSTLEGLLYPIVILNQKGNIRFMNAEARCLLAEGLDQRLAAHVRSRPEMGPITQVRFKLQDGSDLILRIRLGEIEWLGEKATQVSICNVTPYLAAIEELHKELGRRKQASEELAGHAPRESPGPAAAQTAEELRSLRVRLDAEVQARRIAQENIAQLQKEMAGYRKTLENPDALREAEKRLAKRVVQLTAAEEQVRSLTEELRTAREANVLQSERVDKLRRFAGELKKKYDLLAPNAQTRGQEQELLQSQLREETARRLAAEAEIERLQRQPCPAKPQEAKLEELDADFLAEMRQEIQAALKAAAPNRLSATAPAQPPGIAPHAAAAQRAR
jgi:hypothetical protein